MKLLLVVATLLTLTVPTTVLAGDADQYRRSYQHEAEGAYAEALADIDALPATSRRTYVYHLRRGWLLYLSGRHWDSIESYRKAIAAAPDAIEPRLGLMLPEAALRLWLDVIATGEQVLAKAPLDYTALSRMAWANYALGRYDEAARLYRKLLRAYPSDVEMRTGLGWSLLKHGRNDAARSQFERVLGIAPDHPAANDGLAACG